MELTFFLKGIGIGFAMAIPIGPIGVLCVRKTLTAGQLRGLIVGLGAATADLLYGCIAAFGLTIISDAINRERFWIRLIGGTLLLIIGARTFLAPPADPKANLPNGGMLRSYISTVVLTLTNPFTVFAFITVFAALDLIKGLGYLSATTLVLGVFTGSALWFLVLSSGVVLFRKKLDLTGLTWVNRIAGILIVVSGIISLASLL